MERPQLQKTNLRRVLHHSGMRWSGDTHEPVKPQRRANSERSLRTFAPSPMLWSEEEGDEQREPDEEKGDAKKSKSSRGSQSSAASHKTFVPNPVDWIEDEREEGEQKER